MHQRTPPKVIERVNNPIQLFIDPIIDFCCGQDSTLIVTPQMIVNLGGPSIILPGIQKVCAGKDHFFAWSTQSGLIYVWGINRLGKLGIEGSPKQPALMEIFAEAREYGWRMLQVSCGLDHSVSLVEVSGEVKIFVWGSNKAQQLGFDASEEGVSIPHHLELNLQPDAIYASHNYTMVLSQGRVYSWGSDEFGRLAQQSFSKHLKLPSQINQLKNISTLALGTYHVLALDREGHVYSWGRALQGQLGHNLKIDSSEPKLIESLGDIIQIACGENHSIFVNSKQELFGCGSSQFGQLGLGDFKSIDIPRMILHPALRVCCGRYHTVVQQQQHLIGFGSNELGQLGISQKKLFSTPSKEQSIQEQQTKAFQAMNAALDAREMPILKDINPHLSELCQNFMLRVLAQLK